METPRLRGVHTAHLRPHDPAAMTKEQRIDGAAFLAALVCAVTFPHPAGAETGHHRPGPNAAAPNMVATTPGVLDSGAWARP
jgi:hypothetical protein